MVNRDAEESDADGSVSVVTGVVETDGGTSGEGAVREEEIQLVGRACHGPIVSACAKDEADLSSQVAARRRRRNLSVASGMSNSEKVSAGGRGESVATVIETELTVGVEK
jgi:hypothetical protein